MLVGEGSGGTGVHTGERGCACGSTEGVRAEGVVEVHALGADAVLIGGFEDGMSGEGEGVGALAFAEEVDEVGALWFYLRFGWRGCYAGCGERARHGECALKKVAPCGLALFLDSVFGGVVLHARH